MDKKVKLVKFILVTLVVWGCTLLFVPTPVEAQKVWELKGQSAWSPKLDTIWDPAPFVMNLIEKYTDGQVKMNLHSGGTFCPPMQEYDSVASGDLDFGMGCPCYGKTTHLAIAMYCDSPGNIAGVEEIVWLYHGGGLKILQDLFKKHYNSMVLPYGILTSEVFLYSNKPINTWDDMVGLKMRAVGLRNQIYKYLGILPLALGGGAIPGAMQKGEIDAFEFANIASGISLNFHEIARYIYYMPIKSAHSITILTINLDVWNRFPKDVKEAIEKACYDSMMWTYTHCYEQDVLAMKKFADAGCELRLMPEAVNKQFSEAAAKFYAIKAKTDPDIARVLESWDKFAGEYGKFAPFMEYLDKSPYFGLAVPYKELR